MPSYLGSPWGSSVRIKAIALAAIAALGFALAACSSNGMTDTSDDDDGRIESGSNGGGY